MADLMVVVGGQYGSEGKGAVAAWLATHSQHDRLVAVRVAGPNAGHSVVDDQGRKFALRQLPASTVVRPDATIVLAAGSEIDLDVLDGEVCLLEQAGIPVRERLMIDASATIITDEHKKQEEELVGRIGSTGKGIGAARAARALRIAPLYGQVRDDGVDTASELASLVADDVGIMVEAAQGFALGTHAGFYPKCTSSDCRAIDALSMAGISPWAVQRLAVWVVLRTYPIRVAGDSGPLPGETTWAQLGEQTGGYIKPELTTVTRKVRRVGTFDREMAARAIVANGGPGPSVFPVLQFFDYWFPELAGADSRDALDAEHWKRIDEVSEATGPIALLGTGPNSQIDLR